MKQRADRVILRVQGIAAGVLVGVAVHDYTIGLHRQAAQGLAVAIAIGISMLLHAVAARRGARATQRGAR